MVLARSLLAGGEKGWWVPGARVRHFIPRERQTIRYLHDYYVGAGRLLAHLDNQRKNGALRFLGRPLWLWKQAITFELRYRFRRWSAPPQKWVNDLVWAKVSWGQLRHLRARPSRVASPALARGAPAPLPSWYPMLPSAQLSAEGR